MFQFIIRFLNPKFRELYLFLTFRDSLFNVIAIPLVQEAKTGNNCC